VTGLDLKISLKYFMIIIIIIYLFLLSN